MYNTKLYTEIKRNIIMKIRGRYGSTEIDIQKNDVVFKSIESSLLTIVNIIY